MLMDGTKADKIVADQNLNNALILNNYLYIPGKNLMTKKIF